MFLNNLGCGCLNLVDYHKTYIKIQIKGFKEFGFIIFIKTDCVFRRLVKQKPGSV